MPRIRHHLALPMVASRIMRVRDFSFDEVEYLCEIYTGTGTYVRSFTIDKGISDEEMIQLAHKRMADHEYAGNRIITKTATVRDTRAPRPSGRW
jgi:hypothetical protein